MEGQSRFLQSDEQAELTKRIKDLAKSMGGDGLDYVTRVLVWLDHNLEKRKFDEAIFRRRSADQILASGFSTGCSDTALVFIALCRAKGIPASWLEVISRSWLEGKSDRIEGHVFSRVLIDDRWLLVDPANGTVSTKETPDQRRWVVFGEGLDSWDLGIRSFADLKEKFSEFRKNV